MCSKPITESDWYDFEGKCIECYAEQKTAEYQIDKMYEKSIQSCVEEAH